MRTCALRGYSHSRRNYSSSASSEHQVNALLRVFDEQPSCELVRCASHDFQCSDTQTNIEEALLDEFLKHDQAYFVSKLYAVPFALGLQPDIDDAWLEESWRKDNLGLPESTQNECSTTTSVEAKGSRTLCLSASIDPHAIGILCRNVYQALSEEDVERCLRLLGMWDHFQVHRIGTGFAVRGNSVKVVLLGRCREEKIKAARTFQALLHKTNHFAILPCPGKKLEVVVFGDGIAAPPTR